MKNDLYMDDLMTSTSNEEDTVLLQKKHAELLSRGGFSLHKWASNSKLVLLQIPDHDKESQNAINIKVEDILKTLGINWNSQIDNFELNINMNFTDNNLTKRNILSTIAKSFDPLCWQTPEIILLKIFMQKMWLAGLTADADEELPHDLKNKWITYI
ncbi:unnamed protein product [Parnassius mnemosyne]|uniref:Uncharacterized protein n=1 Tax=Parnassius mnemosyne TaxID=213953 RepID=A0AAV1KSJ3_9NEOP